MLSTSMLRSWRKFYFTGYYRSVTTTRKRFFLNNDYKCNEAWNSQTSSPVLKKVNLNDFYNSLDQHFSSKGVISAIDVDIFANAVKDSVYLEELRDLLHKLRLSAETGNTLDSTHHATIRNFIEFDMIEELIEILKNPLTFGIFLDNYTANILIDKLITSQRYEQAAEVASLVMLQEEFTNDITCALCQYACYKYISEYTAPPESAQSEEKANKVEEIKIRVKFLRNPYFDDHFDIKDTYILSGKTLAWVSERISNDLNRNLQIIGWYVYKKYDKLLSICEEVNKTSTQIFGEVIDVLKKRSENLEPENKDILQKCVTLLNGACTSEHSLEDSLKISIENAINKIQNKDILDQKQLFKSWTKLREEKLEEQTKRLDRARRMQLIQEKQNMLKEEEQKLWFFENEEQIDLQIEEKEKLIDTSVKKDASKLDDENYVPPEILPKRK